MGQVSIRFTDTQEKELRKKAQLENKSLAEYLRHKILSDEIQEKPLSRVTIENEIDALKKTVSRLNNNMVAIEKIIIGDTKEYSELILGFFNEAIESEETKRKIYEEARVAKQEYIKKIFGGD